MLKIYISSSWEIMTSEEKKTLKENIFKLIIGIILLITCFLYLDQNRAEKIARFSNFDLIFQKVEVAYFNVLGKDGALLDQKYNLEKQYLDLIHLAEEKWCSNPQFLLDLNTTYQNLLSEWKENIDQYIARYTLLGSDFQMQLETANCGA